MSWRSNFGLTRRGLLALAGNVGLSCLAWGQSVAPLFEEIPAAQSGIQFIHENAMSPEHYLPETVGPGCAFFDYDGDGWMDIYLVNSGPCDFYRPEQLLKSALYRNNRDGTFTDVTQTAGVAAGIFGMEQKSGECRDAAATAARPAALARRTLSPRPLGRDKRRGAAVLAFAAVGLLALIPAALAQAEDAAAFARAVELHRAGDHEQAVQAYKDYLAAHPANAEAISNLGAVYSRLGRYGEAIEQYQRALEFRSNPAIRFNLGLAYHRSAQIGKAAEQLAKVVEALPDNRSAVILLADCHLRMGEHKKVIELLSPIEARRKDDRAVNYAGHRLDS